MKGSARQPARAPRGSIRASPGLEHDSGGATARALLSIAGNRALGAWMASRGESLPRSLREEVLANLGPAAARARLHRGAPAAALADALDADAVTIGGEVYLGEEAGGRSWPVLVHELTHVVQQARGGPSPPFDATAPHETAAERAETAAGPVIGATGIGPAAKKTDRKRNRKREQQRQQDDELRKQAEADRATEAGEEGGRKERRKDSGVRERRKEAPADPKKTLRRDRERALARVEGKDAAGAAVSHKRQAVGGANEAARRERQLGPAIDAAQREADLEAARRNRDPNVVENLPSETREKIEQSEKRALGENARKSLKQAQLDENVARGRAAEAGLGTSAPRQVPLRHGERLERNEDGSRPRVQHTVPDELRPPAAGSNREQAVNIKSTDLGHFNQIPSVLRDLEAAEKKPGQPRAQEVPAEELDRRSADKAAASVQKQIKRNKPHVGNRDQVVQYPKPTQNRLQDNSPAINATLDRDFDIRNGGKNGAAVVIIGDRRITREEWLAQRADAVEEYRRQNEQRDRTRKAESRQRQREQRRDAARKKAEAEGREFKPRPSKQERADLRTLGRVPAPAPGEAEPAGNKPPTGKDAVAAPPGQPEAVRPKSRGGKKGGGGEGGPPPPGTPPVPRLPQGGGGTSGAARGQGAGGTHFSTQGSASPAAPATKPRSTLGSGTATPTTHTSGATGKVRSSAGGALGNASRLGSAGQNFADLSEGKVGAVAERVGTGALIGQVVKRVPALKPLIWMKDIIGGYDETAKAQAFTAGEWVENKTGSRLLGAFASSGTAVASSTYRGVIRPVGQGIEAGANALAKTVAPSHMRMPALGPGHSIMQSKIDSRQHGCQVCHDSVRLNNALNDLGPTGRALRDSSGIPSDAALRFLEANGVATGYSSQLAKQKPGESGKAAAPGTFAPTTSDASTPAAPELLRATAPAPGEAPRPASPEPPRAAARPRPAPAEAPGPAAPQPPKKGARQQPAPAETPRPATSPKTSARPTSRPAAPAPSPRPGGSSEPASRKPASSRQQHPAPRPRDTPKSSPTRKVSSALNWIGDLGRTYHEAKDTYEKAGSLTDAAAKGGETLLKARNPVLGLYDEYKQKIGPSNDAEGNPLSGQDMDEAEAAISTVMGFVGGNVFGKYDGKAGELINAANNAAQGNLGPEKPPVGPDGQPTGGEPELNLITATTEGLSEATPSGFGRRLFADGYRGIYNTGKLIITGDGSNLDRQGQQMVQGKGGPALQGYFMVAQVLADAPFDGWEKAMEKAAKAGKGSWADKVGSKLGDETYEFINEDLPEAAEFAKKDFARMKNAIADSALGRTVANLPNKVEDAKAAVQRKATQLKHEVAEVQKGALDVRDQAVAEIRSVGEEAGRIKDAAVERVTQEAGEAKEAVVATVQQIGRTVDTAIDDTVGLASDTAQAAYDEAAELKESAKRKAAAFKSAIGSLW